MFSLKQRAIAARAVRQHGSDATVPGAISGDVPRRLRTVLPHQRQTEFNP